MESVTNRICTYETRAGFSLFVLDTDIQVFPSTTAAEILEESMAVAQTKGEWELINIEVVPSTLKITDGKYSQIKYYVCC